MTEDLFDCEVESGLSQLHGKALMQRLIINMYFLNWCNEMF